MKRTRWNNRPTSWGRCILVPPKSLKTEFDTARKKLPGGMHFEGLSEKARNIVVGGIATVFDVLPSMMKKRMRQDGLL